MDRRKEYVEAILKEIEQRRDETGQHLRTIYIGGGTPSTLEAEDIARILETIGTQDATEITMELNPGDATEAYLRAIRQAGINRLSIGIQSFKDSLLSLIGRRHTAQQAIEAVRMAQQAGFDNISIDLMYALPTQTMEDWKADIETALSLGIQHISTYGLMYEEGTALTRMRDKGELEPIEEETENAQYDYLCERLQQAGFVHYEVSNFALPGKEAMHNSAYWDHTPYIGIGAGAHSYTGKVRSWNPDNLEAYLQGVPPESETLTETDLYNERIMLGLRTRSGVAKEAIQGDVQAWIDQELLQNQDGRIRATQQGLHILNRIIESLMI